MSYTCIDITKSQRVCLDSVRGYVIEEYTSTIAQVAGTRKRIRRKRKLAKVIPHYAFGRYCKRCAHPLPHSWSRCSAHDSKLEHLDATLAVGLYYTQNVQNLLGLQANILTSYIRELKQSRGIVPVLAASMALIIKAEVYGIGVRDVDIITFVPKHRDELKVDAEDGTRYNQAELLARQIAKYLGIEPVEVVHKIRPLSLTGLSAHERYRQSRQVYQLQREVRPVIEDKRILLIDDVRTSGATGNAIAELLKEAGASKVYLLVAGRATHYETLKKIIKEYGGYPEVA